MADPRLEEKSVSFCMRRADPGLAWIDCEGFHWRRGMRDAGCIADAGTERLRDRGTEPDSA